MNDNETRLCKAILVQALRDLNSKDDEVVKAALDWLLDAHPDADFLDLILDEATGLTRDDINAHIRRTFLED